MNTLDKIVNAIDPVRGLRRQKARAAQTIINSGYGNYGASRAKKSLKGWLFGGGSADEDIHENINVLRERSRDLYMGVPIATGALKTCRTNVIGSGLKLKSRIDNEFLKLSESDAVEIEQTIEREFALWADTPDCDIERMDNFYELQQLAFLNWLMSGDVITLLPINERKNMPYDLRIQLVEADRLCNPNNMFSPKITQGIEVNENGEIVAFHICTKHPLSWTEGRKEWKRVAAYGDTTGRRNVLFIANRERIGQKRGVPLLAPVIESLKQLGRYTDAELIAAVVSGMFTVFVEKENPTDAAAFGEIVPEDEQVDGRDESTLELAPGAIIDLGEGEKANAVSPGRPNANFDGFVISICRQIGAALEIPYELLIKNFTSSYSASRAALLEAWKSFRMYRTWMATDFCQPIFEEWMCEAVAKGRVKAPGFFNDPMIRKAYCGAEWSGPAQGQLDPTKEANAAILRVKNGFSTYEREAVEMTGTSYTKNIKQIKQEVKMLREVNNAKTNEQDEPK